MIEKAKPCVNLGKQCAVKGKLKSQYINSVTKGLYKFKNFKVNMRVSKT